MEGIYSEQATEQAGESIYDEWVAACQGPVR